MASDMTEQLNLEKSFERRDFLRSSAIASFALPLAAPSSRAADGDSIAIGIIGVGGMGMNHLKQLARLADVAVAFVCDVDRGRLENAVKAVQEISGKTRKGVLDLRDI